MGLPTVSQTPAVRPSSRPRPTNAPSRKDRRSESVPARRGLASRCLAERRFLNRQYGFGVTLAGVSARRPTFFFAARQRRRQENAPRLRGPSGCPPYGSAGRGLRKLALRAQTCAALFPPVEPSSRRVRGVPACRRGTGDWLKEGLCPWRREHVRPHDHQSLVKAPDPANLNVPQLQPGPLPVCRRRAAQRQAGMSGAAV